jgi:hypothetical protein
MKAVAVFAALAAAGVVVAVVQTLRVYRDLDDAFDDIIAAEYTTNPATWPRAIKDPS